MFSNVEIRDYFAGLAMQELLILYTSDPELDKHNVAELAYLMADAMMQERVKRDYTVK